MPQTSRDLEAERARTSFAPTELNVLLRGDAHTVEARHRLLARIAADPLLGEGRLDDSFLSRAERFDKSLARMRRVHELGLPKDEAFVATRLFREGGALDKAGGFGLHTGMFVPTIELLGSDEQRATWLPLARSCAILGAYAQTELAHGTNLARLETTATFDPRSDTFELHSPTVGSIKWWPGGLGKWATHAVVMAQLTTADGKARGQQSFIVQLRDLRTHLPLPGIELGDIGPKMGYDRVDNGFLRLCRVRVPRAHMLCRHAQVRADGSFVLSSDNPRAVYGTMLFIRVYLVEEASLALQHATTIAARYSAVRRQGGAPTGAADGGGETRPPPLERAVLDYQTQQTRLLPLIAAAYAVHFAAGALRVRYDLFRASQDVRTLPDLHATSAALKSFTTSLAASGVETCRLLCGGHGYSHASGLPALYAEFAPSQTYEGDNPVMLLQAARWIVKQLGAGAARQGEGGAARDAPDTRGRSPPDGAARGAAAVLADPGAYLRDAGRAVERASAPYDGSPAELGGSAAAQLCALREAARVLAVRAAAALHAHVRSGGAPYEVAWSERASADLLEAARAHARYLLAACFDAAVVEAHAARAASRATLGALGALRDLHVLSACDEGCARVLLESRYLTPEHTLALRARLLELLPAVRRDAVGLVDAFGLTDLELNSVLGRADGNVYEHMLAWARRSPLNATHVLEGFERHVRPIMGKCTL